MRIGDRYIYQHTLHPTQYRFIHSPARYSFYVGGIGSGKTFAGAIRAIAHAAEQPRSLGVIGAPTYTMLRDTTQRTVFELLPPAAIARFNVADNHLTLSNGAEILFRSTDAPDRLRGLNLAWFWLDEAPLCGYYAWQILKGRLRQRVRSPGGSVFPTAAWATGTPHGRDAYWRDFEGQPRRGHVLYRAATAENAHNLPPDFIAELGYTGAFADQELRGLFVAFEGLVYPFDASFGDDQTGSKPPMGDPATGGLDLATGGLQSGGNLRRPPTEVAWADVIGGVDWGFTNPAVGLVFARDGDGRWWQLEEFYQRRAPLEEVLLPALLDLTRRHGVSRWYCGPDQPEHIAALAAALARERLPALALKADNAVRPGIQTVTALLARRADGTRGLYVAPACVRTIAEYATYSYATAPGDPSSPAAPAGSGARDPSEEPIKQNDHCLDATRYALHTAIARERRVAGYLADLARRAARAHQSQP
jgi:hypothetical protein